MKIIITLFSLMLITSCSTVSTIEPGKFFVSCHYLKSDSSCAEVGATDCAKGYKVLNNETKWSFFEGFRKKMVISCNK
jgi:hypothetical protein